MDLINNLKNVLAVIVQPELERVQKKFKDIHKGESCYIFGDGISLKWFDLDAFPTLPSFILSYLFFHKRFASLGPTYGFVTEPYYFYPYFRLPWPPHTLWRNRIQSQYRRFIDQYSEIDFFVNLSNYPVLRRRNVYHLFRSVPGSHFGAECVSSGQVYLHGSLRSAITLAIYMGFANIYLVGCDYTHNPSRSLHWYEKGTGIVGEHPAYNQKFFELAQKYTKLATITLDGGSEILPHVTYKEFTGQTPYFRENTELAERRYLELLSTWPGYTVF